MLILASNSASRQAMLTAAGVEFVVRPAAIDERGFEATLGAMAPDDVAVALAMAKARAVSEQVPDALVLGSDSLVDVQGRRFDKPTSREDAEAHLRYFSGRTILLHSAAAFARGGKIAWNTVSTARLRVRTLSPAFIAGYLDAEWPAVAGCVGVFRIEGRGVQLFESIDGDHFTVLGMPLLPVLGALRAMGVIAA